MSTIVPRTREIPLWLARAFERDYCPFLEPYLGWLRQPVGWFLLATVASILVGVTISPLGLSLAGGLIALLIVGLVYPYLAVRLTSCELISQLVELEEDDAHQVQLHVRNRCPWPLWGLIIEGYVVNPPIDAQSNEGPQADIALSYVPWLSQVTYRLTLRPRMRGHYPAHAPQLTCSFPFGLWTSRRGINRVAPLVVRPKQVKLVGVVEQTGRNTHHSGDGSRCGGHADFLGLRDYRQGDSIRQIHWAHTARLDSLVVCERSAAEQSTWEIRLNTSVSEVGSLAARENLAWRVRIAASLCTLLHHQSIAFTLDIQGESAWIDKLDQLRSIRSAPVHGPLGNRLEQALKRLTNVPLDGQVGQEDATECRVVAQGLFVIEPVTNALYSGEQTHWHLIRVRMLRQASDWRRLTDQCEVTIDLNQAIAPQINNWLQRSSHGRQAA